MNKLYRFLLGMVVLLLATSQIKAQTYTIQDYQVRTTTGSGSTWSEITGTHISNLEGSVYQLYYLTSSPLQVPFNFRFLNLQVTTSNTFQVNGCGSVIFSPTWYSGTNNYPDYDGYYAYGGEYDYGNGGSTYNYTYPYTMYNSEYDGGSYGYYTNYTLYPFACYDYNYPAISGQDYQWTVLGSAPSRRLVVQAKNVPARYYGYNSTLRGSWQTVVYESGISNFQFNYGPQVGTLNTSGSYTYGWSEDYFYNAGSYTYKYAYGGFTGMKALGGQYMMLGWFGTPADANSWQYPANTDNTGTNPKWQYNTYGYTYSYTSGVYTLNNAGQTVADNTGHSMMNGWKNLPTTSYRLFIAWPYDFAATSITNPADQSIKLKDASMTPTAVITNQGKQTPTSVTVRMIIRRTTDSIPAAPGQPAVPYSAVYSQDVILTGAQVPAPFQSSTVSFPTFTPTVYDIYRDTVYVLNLQPTADQDNSNNMTWDEFTVSPPNNIKALAILNPAAGSRTPINVPTPVAARFMNAGANDQSNVPVTMVVKDPSGNVVYRDTVIIPFIASGVRYDTTFKDWTPAVNGNHTVLAIALMATDQLRADDTVRTTIAVRYESDAAAISVVNPQQDEEKPYTKRWQPTGLFQSVGVADLFDVAARVQIRRCADNALVFQADSNIPELNVDQNLVRFSFPSKQGNYDITKLAPGCYTQCVIARYSTDGDRTNDTACTNFTIIDRLKGDIYVGVGQRFQSLHAAVDSMRFRGIGGNLRLILTDARYTENGQTSVSSGNGALDFGGITGVSDTSTITFMPKQGVSPRIVFTGNSNNLFYFGAQSPSWVKFDGYNPVGVAVPDKLIAEPTKRGITIVDSTTNAGAVFAFEWASHNMSVRNLRILGNGMFTSDSSAGVRLYMEPSQASYLQNIRDTVPLHHITVENCEIGNMKYGITDHGSHTQFNLGLSRFMDWRNHDNVFTRNTIGSATYPIGVAGIRFNNEQNTTISHNEISNVNATLAGATSAYGIQQGNLLQADTGNSVGMWIDGNRIQNIAASGSAYGVQFNQAAVIYAVGSGVNAVKSALPLVTMNRTTNNMILDLRGATNNYPISYQTGSVKYYTDRDSVFNNSISTSNATVNISMQQQAHPFLWNNILQNTGTGSYTNYSLSVPRPFVSALSSDYNLFDLRGTAYTFASVTEYDAGTGTLIQTRNFRRLNDWITFTGQDRHSVVGNPMFSTTDPLHLPGALSYIASPASNNGAWLGTATQRRDFDGDQRLMGNSTPDIGADEFEGFQYTNDLAVMSIVNPAGLTSSATDTTTVVTMENPWYITASVKNLSSQAIFGRTLTATLQRSTDNGATWTQIYTSTTAPMNFDVNETKNVSFAAPTLTTPTATTLYRVTVTAPNDQNNANNVQTKTFRVILKTQAIVVSYTSATPQGLANRDSVTAALRRLGIDGLNGHAFYDSLDRAAFGSNDIDYSPWWTVVWATGDPTQALNSSNSSVGEGALSFKETEELTRYLQAGQTYAKKSLVIAGQNIASYNDNQVVPGLNNRITDTAFMQTMLHTRYRYPSPVSGTYNGMIRGMQPVYWKFNDNLVSNSPDVVQPSFTTPAVGPEVTGFAYAYATHNLTPADSGAGTTYSGPTYNTVFFAFDWADGVQTSPSEAGPLTSGTTRILRGALDFLQSHAGTVLPVEFTDVTAQPIGSNALVSWKTANQTDVARFEVEMLNGKFWSKIGTTAADKYAYTYAGIESGKTYTFRVVAVDLNGTRTESKSVELATGANTEFTLDQNYPNPFNPSTTVSFNLGTDAQVTLRVLDVTGKEVKTVMTNESLSAGPHTTSIVADDLASGSYVYEMIAVQPNGQTVVLSRKMTLNK